MARLSDKCYIDQNGYVRFKDSKKLVHRWVAYNKIYKAEKSKYDHRFREYQIHHKDRNKLNNNYDNLELILIDDHRKRHGFLPIKVELILSIIMIIVGLFLMKWHHLTPQGTLLVVMGAFILYKDIKSLMNTK